MAFNAVLMLAPFVYAADAADLVSGAYRSFVALVSQDGMFEVIAGQLASEQGNV